eukprot:scaffold15780_cov68-Phaeocystis_antarctica.AAC.15
MATRLLVACAPRPVYKALATSFAAQINPSVILGLLQSTPSVAHGVVGPAGQLRGDRTPLLTTQPLHAVADQLILR